ncbi:Vascular endothelial growth factor receptor 1 [Orchesella cincta]|uniref:Vascular endothelial growth factor receptor 1 n=1 Tax=Orchesella cincta TaxID=48709 RepID=A0A1D2N8Z5_ORCCI|nr:Vascular endothelial growth factor receptor 1 [Orchesella cincta]
MTIYEVPHKNWNFGDTLLGTGNFGIVIKGTVEVGSRKSIIAIKTIKSPDDIVDFKTTLLELKIMAHIGHHHHVVKLVAASTDEIQKRKVLIGVEFCANGSLLSYMQKRKRLFTNNVHDGCIHFSNENNAEMVDGVYDNLITSDISTLDLYKWSFQIACGMKFLESKNLVYSRGNL